MRRVWEWLAESWTEILGFATGLACVILAARRNVWTYPIGIANYAVFVVLFATNGIYASAALQLVYLGFGVHGWWRWTRRAEHDADYVATTPRRALPLLVLAGLAGLGVLWWVLATFTDSQVALADATTTAVSLVAQYMLNRKWIQTWFVWVAVDVVFSGLAFSQGLWITGALYLGFIVVSLLGWRSWRKVRRAQRADAAEPVTRPAGTRPSAQTR